ncbi:MAG: hypothetical protein R3264_11905, partial [Anaerolineae bacterium]|nr:hypothetical protein [Anaerolineae bacterium]
MTDYKSHLRRLRENYNVLMAQKARWAAEPPLTLLNQIADHKTAIDLTEQALTGDLSQADWLAKVQPLLVAIN